MFEPSIVTFSPLKNISPIFPEKKSLTVNLEVSQHYVVMKSEEGVVSFYGVWKIFWTQLPPDKAQLDEELDHRFNFVGNINPRVIELANQCVVFSSVCSPDYSLFEDLLWTKYANAQYKPFSILPENKIPLCETSTFSPTKKIENKIFRGIFKRGACVIDGSI